MDGSFKFILFFIFIFTVSCENNYSDGKNSIDEFSENNTNIIKEYNGNFVINSNSSLEEINNFDVINGNIEINYDLRFLELKLLEINGDLIIYDSNIEEIKIHSYKANRIVIEYNKKLEILSINELKEVEEIQIEGNENLGLISAPSLIKADELYIYSNGYSAKFESIEKIGKAVINENKNLIDLNMKKLKSVTESITISNNEFLQMCEVGLENSDLIISQQNNGVECQ